MHSAFIRLLCLCCILPVCEISAQEPKPVDPNRLGPLETKPAPPADPFVKPKPGARPQLNAGGGAGAAAALNPGATPADAPAVPEPLPVNLLFLFETYTLPQDALDVIHTDAPEAQHFYDRVRKLAADGKGSLDSVIALPTRSGQRATTESVDEVLYPTEFSSTVPGRNFGFPSAHEVRPTGHRLELDPVLGLDEKVVDMNIAPDFTRLSGFTLQKADEKTLGEIQPLFSSRRLANAVSATIGLPTLVGTSSKPKNSGLAHADGEGSVAVTFATVRLSGPRQAPPPVNPAPDTGLGNLRLVFRFFSLPRVTARDLLAKGLDADDLLAAVRALPAGDAKLERLLTMQTRSGQRSTTEESVEYVYGTEAKPPRVEEGNVSPAPAQTLTPPVYGNKETLSASFTAFEQHPLGWRIEIDPVVHPGGLMVDLNLAADFAQYRGNLQGHEMLARYPEMPVIASQKLTTAVTTAMGRQLFLGTMSAPHDTGVNGREDDQRAWFGFVMVTME